MKVSLMIWALLLLPPAGALAQADTANIDVQYRRYKLIFEQETDSLDRQGKDSAEHLSVLRSGVPCWFSGPFAQREERLEVIGVSDPWTDTLSARKQAIIRAMYLGALMAGTRISSLVDHYGLEHGESGLAGQYIDYFEYGCHAIPDVMEITVLQETLLISGEYIVLVDFPLIRREKKSLLFLTTGMVTEFENKGRYETNARMEFSAYAGGPESPPVTRFITRTIDELTETESSVDGKPVTLALARYRYQLPSDCPLALTAEGARTDRGLWNALFDSVLRELAVAVRAQPSTVMSASDLYTGKSQMLSREVLTGEMTFRIAGLQLQDNRLRAVLDQFNLKQP